MRPIIGGAIAVAIALAAASEASADGVLDLLRPGSRPTIGRIGADPFLSPLDDETSWWSQLGFDESAGSKMEYRFSDPTRGESIRGGRLQEREVSWLTSAEGWRMGLPWRVAARLRQPDDVASLEGASGTLALHQGGSVADVGLRVGPRPWLVLQGASPVWNQPAGDLRSHWGAGARWLVSGRAAIQGSWERARIPDALTSKLQGTPIAASLNLGLESFRLDGRMRLWGGWLAEGSAVRTKSDEIEGRDLRPSYQIAPRGSSTMEQGSVIWVPTRRTRLLLRWTHSEADVAADLRWGGQRFGQVNYGRATVRSYLAAIESSSPRGTRRLFEGEWARAEGRARGEAESWPFSSTIVDLMGLRRIYKAEGDAEWLRWHAGIEHRLGKAMWGREGVEWIDVFPRGTLESWRPAVLVFGRADIHVDELNVRRLQLAVLSLAWSARFGNTGVDAGLEQFVFGRSFKQESEPSHDGPPPDEAASPRRDSNHSLGVTRIRLAVSRAF